MNSKEKTVIIFLLVAMFIGAGISFLRNYRTQRNLDTITIKQSSDDSVLKIKIDTIFQDENRETYISNLLNINTASKRELESLKGIGTVLAQRIIDYREKNNGFKTKQELLKVSGIGARKFAGIKDKIKI